MRISVLFVHFGEAKALKHLRLTTIQITDIKIPNEIYLFWHILVCFPCYSEKRDFLPTFLTYDFLKRTRFLDP